MGVGCGPGGCPGGIGCVMASAMGCETHASLTVTAPANSGWALAGQNRSCKTGVRQPPSMTQAGPVQIDAHTASGPRGTKPRLARLSTSLRGP